MLPSVFVLVLTLDRMEPLDRPRSQCTIAKVFVIAASGVRQVEYIKDRFWRSVTELMFASTPTVCTLSIDRSATLSID